MRSLAHATQLGGSIDHGERHLRVPTSEPARAGNVDRSTDEAVELEQQRALLRERPFLVHEAAHEPRGGRKVHVAQGFVEREVGWGRLGRALGPLWIGAAPATVSAV